MSKCQPLLVMQDASTDCSYRISQEGLPLVLPHVTKQLVRLSPTDFMRLLTERNCSLPDNAKRGLTHPLQPPADGALPSLDNSAAPAEDVSNAPISDGETCGI